MTLADELRTIQAEQQPPAVAGWEAQREMVEKLYAAGLLKRPEPPRVAPLRGLPRPVRVRFRAT